MHLLTEAQDAFEQGCIKHNNTSACGALGGKLIYIYIYSYHAHISLLYFYVPRVPRTLYMH